MLFSMYSLQNSFVYICFLPCNILMEEQTRSLGCSLRYSLAIINEAYVNKGRMGFGVQARTKINGTIDSRVVDVVIRVTEEHLAYLSKIPNTRQFGRISEQVLYKIYAKSMRELVVLLNQSKDVSFFSNLRL